MFSSGPNIPVALSLVEVGSEKRFAGVKFKRFLTDNQVVIQAGNLTAAQNRHLMSVRFNNFRKVPFSPT